MHRACCLDKSYTFQVYVRIATHVYMYMLRTFGRLLDVCCLLRLYFGSNPHYLRFLDGVVCFHVDVALHCRRLMNSPPALDMRDWKRGGALVGFWKYVSESAVTEAHGRTLLSDYVPYNYSGAVVAASLGKRKKRLDDRGYWKLHLPRVHHTVDYHRQLLQDFLEDSAQGFDSHHLERGRDCNCISNLQKRPDGPHRAGHVMAPAPAVP
jgi:hypothetical protein